ncbi:hypothetical protein G7Z17_g771 [Cylindrodendrum hubeiense]|uniref:Uncharacterized protein n=1 Tax=Cylindrodendrum hubeiense TaxID=595255 RepID=A0A9P5LM06_9HYPO|nr:hypothetical protein G7Z17_g771 [Cylindrodendrum hubeiense]
MYPFLPLRSRGFYPGLPSDQFSDQWENPRDVFSVLLILGGDIVSRALAQLAGGRVTPVAFSFGWVAYAVTAVVSAVGENKLMPLPDCACKVINGRSGYARDNSSWVVGRIMRDFDTWMDDGHPHGSIRHCLDDMINERWKQDRDEAGNGAAASQVPKPTMVGLCISVYRARDVNPGSPGFDLAYCTGFGTALVQLGIAAIPCVIHGDWGIVLVTAVGITLSFMTGALPQWATEKWACRRHTKKTIILTRGNGSQHAIVIIGDGKGIDLEDLAAGQTNVDVSASSTTRIAITILAAFWILLLITAAGIQHHTWYLLTVGGIGILQNIFVAGWPRFPKDLGVPLEFEKVIGKPKVMDALFEVEEEYPHVGRSMLDTFFPGKLRPGESRRWDDLEKKADAADEERKRSRAAAQTGPSSPEISHTQPLTS